MVNNWPLNENYGTHRADRRVRICPHRLVQLAQLLLYRLLLQG